MWKTLSEHADLLGRSEYSPNQFLDKNFFATSYSKPALRHGMFWNLSYIFHDI